MGIDDYTELIWMHMFEYIDYTIPGEGLLP